jgi:hypothetical protein
MRTCVGCRTVRPKRELVRLVRTPDLRIELDLTGKKSGRGAYICPRQACLEAALKKNRLLQALAKGLDEAQRQVLRFDQEERERLHAWIREQEAAVISGER